MNIQPTFTSTPINVEERLWQNELEIIAEDNDFFLNLLTSLQSEQVIPNRYYEKTNLFFNYFHYFFQQTKHLKLVIEQIAKQDSLKQEIKKQRLREEVSCLVQKYEIFKNNFKSFLSTLTFNKAIFTYYF